jgi:REP element-mobilizing transposase RayT
LLIKSKPALAPADVARTIKSNSSKRLHETFPQLAAFDWQDGYTVFSLGRSGVDQVRAYIAKQEQHHLRTSFIDELKMFLKKYGVEFKPGFLD